MTLVIFSFSEDVLGCSIRACQMLRGDVRPELVHVGLCTNSFYTHRVLGRTELHRSNPYDNSIAVPAPFVSAVTVLDRGEEYVTQWGQMNLLSPLWGDTCVAYVRYLLCMPQKRQSVSNFYHELKNGLS